MRIMSMMLFRPEEEPGVRLRLCQQTIGWPELGINAGFRQRARPHSQVLAWQVPDANCREGEVVSAALPFCHAVDLKPLFHQQLPFEAFISPAAALMTLG